MQAKNIQFRVGQGYDVHRLVVDRPLILAGVLIENETGLLGHSDADVLLHAVIDAILGASAQGDIGSWFSDADPAFKNVNSGVLLQQVLQSLTRLRYELVNVDCTIICQSPKLAPYMQAMRDSLSQLLNLPLACINIKAKTNEKLGYLGNKEAIEAQAVVLLSQTSEADVD